MVCGAKRVEVTDKVITYSEHFRHNGLSYKLMSYNVTMECLMSGSSMPCYGQWSALPWDGDSSQVLHAFGNVF